MSPFDRRSFVVRSLTVLGGAAAPAWLARGFGFAAPSSTTQDPQPAAKVDLVAWRKQQLAEALATAKAHGKPLLVLVVPDDKPVAWGASEWFGAWMTHGGPLARETFGLCTLACARMGEIEAVAGVRGDAVAKTTKAVTMLLVDPTRAGQGADEPVRAVRIEPELPIESLGARTLEGVEPREQAETAALQRKGLAAMTEALQAGLVAHGASLAELAKASSSTLDATQQQALAAWVKDGKSTPHELLVRGLAALRGDLAGLPETVKTARLAELSKAVFDVVVRQQVAGSRWRTRGVCASQFESPTENEKSVSVVPCGMAMVPPLCERFLDFYSVGG